MVDLNLFIEHHYKYIVSIIRVKLILTLHLSTVNWRILTTTGCCCKNAAASLLHMLCNIFLPGRVNTTVPRVVAYYQCTLVELYFIEMLPRTVSCASSKIYWLYNNISYELSSELWLVLCHLHNRGFGVTVAPYVTWGCSTEIQTLGIPVYFSCTILVFTIYIRVITVICLVVQIRTIKCKELKTIHPYLINLCFTKQMFQFKSIDWIAPFRRNCP